jgi:hypothetical protein
MQSVIFESYKMTQWKKNSIFKNETRTNKHPCAIKLISHLIQKLIQNGHRPFKYNT